MEGFSRLLKSDAIRFKYAKGTGAVRGKEFHDYHEILLFLGGEVEFYSENRHGKLRSEQIVIIPKESYHQFIITGDENDYHRCVFSFYDQPELAGRVQSTMTCVTVADVTPALSYLFRKAMALTGQEAPDSPLVLRSLLTLILMELPGADASARQDGLSGACIEYITAHLEEELTVPGIAKALNVSVSSLTHSFKKDMNISVYRYVLQKKLILAQRRIAAGESATDAALNCGFHDYSGFYKQYKKMFSSAPSDKNRHFG